MMNIIIIRCIVEVILILVTIHIINGYSSLKPSNYEQLRRLPIEYVSSFNNHGFLKEHYKIKGTPYYFFLTRYGFKESILDRNYIVRVPFMPTEKDWEIAINKLSDYINVRRNLYD